MLKHQVPCRVPKQAPNRPQPLLTFLASTLALMMLGRFLPLAAQDQPSPMLNNPPMGGTIPALPDDPRAPLTYRVFLPVIQGNQVAGQRDLAPLSWDNRLTERGAVLVPATVTPGQGYWRLIEAHWFNTQESQGRHHIFIDMLDAQNQRATAIPVEIRWRDGNALVTTEAKPGEPFATNYAMYALAPAYSAQPADHAPADRVEGMGLGEINEPFLAHHTSYGLTWRWTIAGSELLPTATMTPEPAATPTAIHTPALTATPTITATPPLSTTPVTPTPTIDRPTATATPSPTATLAATATATATATPNLYQFTATVVKCGPYGYGSRFGGIVTTDGAPVDGYRITFSYEPDGPRVPQQPAYSGSGGQPGSYVHILGVAVQRVGDWYAWMIDEEGRRISTIAAFHTDGRVNQCNDATVDFYQ